MSNSKDWAVFLDRDGTINEEVNYLGDPAQLKLTPGAAKAIPIRFG
jgi:D-glycero-D-manno-heptose 1,7-bisphosphate phosphatase